MGKMEGRKTTEEIRGQAAAAKAKRLAHKEKVAAYDVAYKAAAQARREKLAAGGDATPAPSEEKPA